MCAWTVARHHYMPADLGTVKCGRRQPSILTPELVNGRCSGSFVEKSYPWPCPGPEACVTPTKDEQVQGAPARHCFRPEKRSYRLVLCTDRSFISKFTPFRVPVAPTPTFSRTCWSPTSSEKASVNTTYRHAIMKLSVFSLCLLALLTPLAAAWSKEGK